MRDDPASSTSSGISQPSLEARALSEEEIDREMAVLRYWSDHPEERVARIKELDPSWRRNVFQGILELVLATNLLDS